MYLSVLPLNPAFPHVQADLRDANMLFKSVRSLFGHRPADARELFRVWYDRNQAPFLLVQSPQLCNPAALPLRYLRAEMTQHDIKNISDQLHTGQMHEFDLLASFTVRKDGHENALKTDEERTQWMMRKGAQHSFAVASQTDPALPLHFTHTYHLAALKGQRRQVHLAPTRCSGQLCITDVEAFVATVYGGIGRSKALGLGMLLLPRLTLPVTLRDAWV